MMPLTRADRAAMTLALEMLRREPRPALFGRDVHDVYDVLRLGHEASELTARAFYAAWHKKLSRRHERLCEARLALYLRALLRAERGDFGPRHVHGFECGDCGCRWTWCRRTGGEPCACPSEAAFPRVWDRQITPLWELATRHAEWRLLWNAVLKGDGCPPGREYVWSLQGKSLRESYDACDEPGWLMWLSKKLATQAHDAAARQYPQHAHVFYAAWRFERDRWYLGGVACREGICAGPICRCIELPALGSPDDEAAKAQCLALVKQHVTFEALAEGLR